MTIGLGILKSITVRQDRLELELVITGADAEARTEIERFASWDALCSRYDELVRIDEERNQ